MIQVIATNVVVIVKFSFWVKVSFFKNYMTSCCLKGLYPRGKATRIEIITPRIAINIAMCLESAPVPPLSLSRTIFAVLLKDEKYPAIATIK